MMCVGLRSGLLGFRFVVRWLGNVKSCSECSERFVSV